MFFPCAYIVPYILYVGISIILCIYLIQVAVISDSNATYIVYMGQAEIFDIVAAFVAGIMLIGTLSWLIGSKTMYTTIFNSLLGGILLFILSIFELVAISAPIMFVVGLLGIIGVILIFFIVPV